MWQILEILKRFQYFNFEMEYRFLVESTKIENAIFPNKTVLSEANVKTNRMGSTKYFSVWEPRVMSWFDVPPLKFRYSYLKSMESKELEFYLRVLFPCEYPTFQSFFCFIFHFSLA